MKSKNITISNSIRLSKRGVNNDREFDTTDSIFTDCEERIKKLEIEVENLKNLMALN